MILAVDIGNTDITVGCADENKIYFTENIASDKNRTSFEYAVAFLDMLRIHNIEETGLDGAIVSSVVPPLTGVIKEAAWRITRKEPLVVGAGLKMGINIKMDDPKSVGSDQIVYAVAGIKQYGAPLIVADMDTATTMFVIDNNSNYIGGMIAPGIGLSMASLAANAAQLYEVTIEAPKRAIAKNTVESIKSGIVLGCSAMLDGMIDRLQGELGYTAPVVATGKYAGVVVPHCNKKVLQDGELLMKGLWIIYEKNK